MDTLLYILARGAIAFIQALPLKRAAQLGRALGAVAYHLDARHRRVALNNLTACFRDEKSADGIRALAKENFRRIGENYFCAVKTAAMTIEQLKKHLQFVGDDIIFSKSGNKIFAVGHFGNFELYARWGQFRPGYQCATTYRAFNQPSLNHLLSLMRQKSGCLFFERRTEAAALKVAMQRSNLLLGLLADQHTIGGLRLPFFGRECATSPAPAVFALRYDCRLYPAICYRVGLAQWRVEGGEEIPTHENGAPRSSSDIMLDVNRAFEAAIRRDPANWFWVHNRWKVLKSSAETKMGNEELKMETRA